MAIFRRKTAINAEDKANKKPVETPDEVLTPESQTAVKSDKQTVVSGVSKGQAGLSFKLLKAPLVSEKAAILASTNVYVFRVPVEAEKVSIAKAVKDLYGVTVVGVRTARGIGKRVFRGRKVGHRNRWKKAYVSVKKGHKIDLYEGV